MRILIADGYAPTRYAIRKLLQRCPGWEVCGEAANGREAVAKTAALKPDVVIIDIALGTECGVTVAEEIFAATPGLPIVLCTTSPTVHPALESGVRAVVDKSDAGRQLVHAIETALTNKSVKTFVAAAG